MGTHTQVSRRHMLAMSAAGLAMSRVGAASAQDVVVKSDCSIGGFAPEQWDLPFAGVFRVSGDLGTHDPPG